MRALIARMLRPVFDRLGLLDTTGGESPRPAVEHPTCEDRLKHMAGLGFSPGTIYDCGAFIGKWAAGASAIFPQARFVLVEPNPQVHDQIRANTASIKERVQVVAAAVSDQTGHATLNLWDNPRHKNPLTALEASSLLSHVQGRPSNEVKVRITTIDAIAEETGKPPDFLKLDLQGGSARRFWARRRA